MTACIWAPDASASFRWMQVGSDVRWPTFLIPHLTQLWWGHPAMSAPHVTSAAGLMLEFRPGCPSSPASMPPCRSLLRYSEARQWAFLKQGEGQFIYSAIHFVVCLFVLAPGLAWSRVRTHSPHPESRLCVQTCRVALLQRWMTRRSCRWVYPQWRQHTAM